MKKIILFLVGASFFGLSFAKEKDNTVVVLNNKQVLVNKAYTLYNSNKQNLAISIIDEYLQKDDSADLRLLKIAFMEKKYNKKEVLEEINTSINRYPDLCEFKLTKANYLYPNNPEKALEIMGYKNMDGLNKEECLGYVGLSLLKLNKLEDAKVYFTIALSTSDKQNIQWQKLIALINVKENNYKISHDNLTILEME